MTWLVWRQHRNQAIFAALALAAFAVVATITGIRMASTYHDALQSCAATRSCASVGDGLFNGDGAIIDLVNLTVVIPALIALFWGAPLLAYEIEEGTHKLVWTQSVTRRHWLAAKTLALIGAATVVGVALSVTVTWWSRTLDLSQHNRFARFDIQGVVPIAYALFGAALGLTVGLVLRRTLPALATTLFVIVALRLAVANFLRPHYLTPVTKSVSLMSADTGVGGSNWILRSHVLSPTGANVANASVVGAIPAACQRFIGTSRAQVFACLDSQGFREKVIYQPANRFWAFQAIEAGVFVVLAIALVAAAFALIGRDA